MESKDYMESLVCLALYIPVGHSQGFHRHLPLQTLGLTYLTALHAH